MGNQIDAMALWRAKALRDLGGYTTDLRLHGWEDYDLFCRVAERGEEGHFVPEILGRYRVRKHSMLVDHRHLDARRRLCADRAPSEAHARRRPAALTRSPGTL